MTCDIHTFRPIPGATAQYACECGQTAYRARTGRLVEHRSRPPERRTEHVIRIHNTGLNGRIKALPGADRQ
jgi:hypothetical protein